MERPVYRVSQVNAYVKRMLTQDIMLSNLRMTGEIRNYKRHSSGHLYFALKDAGAAISAVMFASDAAALRFLPKEGQKVIVQGAVSLYEKTGQYQFYVRRMEPDGIGALYQAFEALKQKLEAEGLFAPERKRPIPSYPRTVAIVTSPTGAAVQDMIQIARRRHPGIRLIVVPVLVQGEQAAPSIVRGLKRAEQSGADTVIVGRGGGSIEDLWAFNEEIVARAIFQCQTPIISAVGHETDFTIADFVADLRAPTPSAAAELAVDDYRSVVEAVSIYRQRIYRAMSSKTDLYRSRLEHFQTKFGYLSPENKLREQRQRLADLEDYIQNGMNSKLQDDRHRLSIYLERFAGLSPLKKLNQGYSYVADKNKKTLTSVEQVQNGDTIYISVTDGTIEAQVESTVKEERIHGEE